MIRYRCPRDQPQAVFQFAKMILHFALSQRSKLNRRQIADRIADSPVKLQAANLIRSVGQKRGDLRRCGEGEVRRAGCEASDLTTSFDATLASATTNLLGFERIVKNTAIFSNLHVSPAWSAVFL